MVADGEDDDDPDIVTKALDTTAMVPFLSRTNHYQATIRASTVQVDAFLAPNPKTAPLRWRKSESSADGVQRVGGCGGPGLEGGGSAGRGEEYPGSGGGREGSPFSLPFKSLQVLCVTFQLLNKYLGNTVKVEETFRT